MVDASGPERPQQLQEPRKAGLSCSGPPRALCKCCFTAGAAARMSAHRQTLTAGMLAQQQAFCSDWLHDLQYAGGVGECGGPRL